MGRASRRERQRADAERVEEAPRCGRGPTVANETRGKRTRESVLCVWRALDDRVTHLEMATRVPFTFIAKMSVHSMMRCDSHMRHRVETDIVRIHTRGNESARRLSPSLPGLTRFASNSMDHER